MKTIFNRQIGRSLLAVMLLGSAVLGCAVLGCGGDDDSEESHAPGVAAPPETTTVANSPSDSSGGATADDASLPAVTETSLTPKDAPGNPTIAPPSNPPTPKSAGGDSNNSNNSSILGSIFRPPREALPIVQQSEEREEDEAERLIGFLHVGEWKALIAFDGHIEEIAEGGRNRKGDVSVVKINPPQVTLERRGRRWKTVLFDQPVIHRAGFGAVLNTGRPKVTMGGGSSGFNSSGYNDDSGTGFGGNAGGSPFSPFGPPPGQGGLPFGEQGASGGRDDQPDFGGPNVMLPPGIPQ